MRYRPSIAMYGNRFYVAGVRVPRWVWRIFYRLLAPKAAL